jgi:deoxyuridine 5'-triphosphate nucleotidohydrolase
MYDHKVTVDGEIPVHSYKYDSGYDLLVATEISIPPKTVIEVPSNIRVDPKLPIWFKIESRSSTFNKLGLQVQSAIIDNGYRGQLFAITYNPNGKAVKLTKGSRIAQVVPHRVIPLKFIRGDLSESDRGEGGFGSSGL